MNCSRVLLMTHPALIDELKNLVEPGKVLTDADSLNAFGKDWTKHFAPAPLAIVFPKSTEQVQAIVLWANERKVALVPSGGRTGLSAAAVAANGEVVVSFDYMNQVLDINLTDRTVVCQPGWSPNIYRIWPKKTACTTRWILPRQAQARLAAISAPMPAGSRLFATA